MAKFTFTTPMTVTQERECPFYVRNKTFDYFTKVESNERAISLDFFRDGSTHKSIKEGGYSVQGQLIDSVDITESEWQQAVNRYQREAMEFAKSESKVEVSINNEDF
jgi:hypothetical protein